MAFIYLTGAGALALVASTVSVNAQAVKEIKTPKNSPVGLNDLVGLRPDCTQGFIQIPVITTQPTHGEIAQAIISADVPNIGKCPGKNLPVIAVVYVPAEGFVGSDTFTYEIRGNGHRLQTYSYSVTVSEN